MNFDAGLAVDRNLCQLDEACAPSFLASEERRRAQRCRDFRYSTPALCPIAARCLCACVRSWWLIEGGGGAHAARASLMKCELIEYRIPCVLPMRFGKNRIGPTERFGRSRTHSGLQGKGRSSREVIPSPVRWKPLPDSHAPRTFG